MYHFPPDHVRFYDDGPDWPRSQEQQQPEFAFREAFLDAAREAARWDKVDELAILKAWRERRQAREHADVLIPSSVLFDRPDFDSEQIIYHKDHVVAASRTRGREHGLEFVRQCWDELVKPVSTSARSDHRFSSRGSRTSPNG